MSSDDYISLAPYTHETPTDAAMLAMAAVSSTTPITPSSSSRNNNNKRTSAHKQKWRPKAAAVSELPTPTKVVTAVSSVHRSDVIDVEQALTTSAMDVTEPMPQPSTTPPQPEITIASELPYQLLSPILSTFAVTSTNTIHENDGAYRIELNAAERIVFIGSIDVVVLRGAISVHGARLTPTSTTTTSSAPTVYHIHSPHYSPSSLLSLQCETNGTCLRLSRCTLPVALIIDELDEGTETLPIIISGFAALVRQSAISRSKIAYDIMSILPSWSTAINTVIQTSNRSPRIVVCGARGSGKSTLNRLTVNSLLSSYTNNQQHPQHHHQQHRNAVAYIDVDLGQSEFNIYGQITLHIITQPLLGPPHTHQQQPIVSFYMGDNTSGHEPARYINGIRQIYRIYQRGQYKHLPLIVNTQGWLSGLGLSLLQQIIHIIKPNYVWQLTDLSSATTPMTSVSAPTATELASNTPLDITIDNIPTHDNDLTDDQNNNNNNHHHHHHPTSKRRQKQVNEDESNVMSGLASNIRCQHILLQRYLSSKDTASRNRISADQLRTLSLITYFATPAYTIKRSFSILSLPPISFHMAAVALYQQVPYRVPISSMILCLLGQDLHPDLLLASFNAAIVGLCHIDDNDDNKNNKDVEHFKMPQYTNNKNNNNNNNINYNKNASTTTKITTITTNDDNNNSESMIHYRRSRTIRAPLRCYGVGIIHSIDLQNAMFHIFTPTPPADLNHVNALCRSNVALPNVFFATPTTTMGVTNSHVSSHVPAVGVTVMPDAYVSSGMSGHEVMGASAMKSRNTIGRNRLSRTQMTE